MTRAAKGRGRARVVRVAAGLVCAACARGSTQPAAPAPEPVAQAPTVEEVDKSRPAHDVYRNIRLFTRDDVSAAFFDQLMEGISRDLGVSCLHCHDPRGLHLDDLPPRKRLAREAIPVMWGLVATVNATYFAGQGGPVRCWTCHRGAPAPERANRRAGVLPLPSLRSDSLPPGAAAGSNLRVLGGLSRPQLERTMQTIAASLGVECDACHVEGDRGSDAIERKRIARRMLAMTMAIERDSFEEGRGPTCWTCHRGSLTVETRAD